LYFFQVIFVFFPPLITHYFVAETFPGDCGIPRENGTINIPQTSSSMIKNAFNASITSALKAGLSESQRDKDNLDDEGGAGGGRHCHSGREEGSH